MPRLKPGNDLTALCLSGRDQEATDIIARLIQQFPTLESPLWDAMPEAGDLLSGFQRYRHRAVGIFDEEVVARAESTFKELCASQGSVRVLHGDLHHYNVLFDDALGWMVIDPQGIVAELEFELGASLRNPDAPVLLRDPWVLEGRLNTFRLRLGIDGDRTLRWAFSQAVLAVLWPTEPGIGADLSVPFAAMVGAALQVIG